MPRVKEAHTRVVYLSDAPYEGGAERYLVRLAGGLDRKRFEPCLLLPDTRVLDGVDRLALGAGIPVFRHPAGPFAGTADWRALLALLRRHKPDIVHLNLPNPYHAACGWAAPLARLAGARAVVTTEHIADIPAARRRAFLKRLSMPWVSRVITISNKHAELLRQRHGVPGARLQVIYNGVEDPGPAPPRTVETFIIACVGKLEERKGQDVLVEALALLAARRIDARLVLIGEGPARGELEESARRLGVTEKVRFTGASTTVARELQKAHVLAVPSRIEGLPFTLLEGMAAGATVLASALPGLEEVIVPEVTGLLLPPGRPEAWAEALAGLAGDRTRLLRLGAAGRARYAERYTLARMVQETMAVYDGAMR